MATLRFLIVIVLIVMVLVIYVGNEAIGVFEATPVVARHSGSRVPNVRCSSVIPKR
jgi:hypothetical protein